jgi:hypothetical protein
MASHHIRSQPPLSISHALINKQSGIDLLLTIWKIGNLRLREGLRFLGLVPPAARFFFFPPPPAVVHTDGRRRGRHAGGERRWLPPGHQRRRDAAAAAAGTTSTSYTGQFIFVFWPSLSNSKLIYVEI